MANCPSASQESNGKDAAEISPKLDAFSLVNWSGASNTIGAFMNSGSDQGIQVSMLALSIYTRGNDSRTLGPNSQGKPEPANPTFWF